MSFADRYEELVVPAMTGQWAPRVVAAAGIGAGDRVLDVGCGTGVLTRTIADSFGLGGAVVGLDVTEEMIATARRVRPEIDWRVGSATDLPFEDGEFTAVVSQFALMFVRDQVRALEEMRRVLAPGGRLAVAVWWRSPAYEALSAMARERLGDEVADHMVVAFSLGDEARLLDLFRRAGFEGAEVGSHAGFGMFDSIDELVQIEIGAWLEGAPELGISNDDYEAVRAEARQRLAEFRDAEGAARIPMDVHIVTATS